MGKKPTREAVVRALREVAAPPLDPHFERFLECPELQQASLVLARAAVQIGVRKAGSAFTAATSTPITAPPGWLPPPI